MSEKDKSLHLAPDLQVRLSVLASKSGYTLDELAENVLRSHVDEQEKEILEQAEDERRWQRYLDTGRSVALDTVRGRLHRLADEAGRSAAGCSSRSLRGH